MRFFLAVVLGLACVGCGNDDDSSNEPTPQLEVIRANIEIITCTATTLCTAKVTAQYSGGQDVIGTDMSLVASVAEGETPPAVCDSSSKLNEIGYITFEKLKHATKYAFRLCTFRASTASYTAGITASYTTPAAD